MKPEAAHGLLFAVFVLGMSLVSILGIQADGFGSAQNNQRLIILVVVVAIGLLITGGAIYGLLVRVTGRIEVLQHRFPKSTVVTIRKTNDLSTKLLILKDRRVASGFAPDEMPYYSSLVIEKSGAAVFSGNARSVTRTLLISSENILDVATSRTTNGLMLSIDVLNGTVPVQLLIPVVRVGTVGFWGVKDEGVEQLAREIQTKLGLQK